MLLNTHKKAAVGMWFDLLKYAFEGDETRHMPRLEYTYKNKEPEASNGK